MRLDKWLWCARFYKTRSLATEEIGKGRVTVNGQQAKPARDLRCGDTVALRQGVIARTVIVRGLSGARGPAPVAQLLYEETPDSIAAREKAAEQRRLWANALQRIGERGYRRVILFGAGQHTERFLQWRRTQDTLPVAAVFDQNPAKAAPNRPLCLFIMDINRFKSINDAYGHLEGDNALRCLAGVLKDFGGQYGAFAARYGGDEFCLVTEDLSGTPARLAAELQRRLQEAQTGAAAQQKPYTLTVSVGYAVCDGAETEPGQALARADAMLYVNKRAWHRAN